MDRSAPGQINTVHGFSLMELLVVIALIALAVGLASTRLSGPSETTIIKTEARKVISQLRATRSRSLVESRVYHIKAIDDGRAYSIQPSDDIVNLHETITVTLSSGGGTDQIPLDTASIAFYPDGTASGGTVTLAGTDRQLVLTVNWMTGEIKLAPEV